MHLFPFHNNYEKHDFSALYDVIANYYPITSTKRVTEVDLGESPGFKKINAVFGDEVENQKTYRDKWGKFGSILKKKLKKRVFLQPGLLGSGVAGEIVVNEIRSRILLT
jgi:hypothetical protein